MVKITLDSCATQVEMDRKIRKKIPQIRGRDYCLCRCTKRSQILTPFPQDVRCPMEIRKWQGLQRSNIYVLPSEVNTFTFLHYICKMFLKFDL